MSEFPYDEMCKEAVILQESMDRYLDAAYRYHRQRLISPKTSADEAVFTLNSLLRTKCDSATLDFEAKYQEEILRG